MVRKLELLKDTWIQPLKPTNYARKPHRKSLSTKKAVFTAFFLFPSPYKGRGIDTCYRRDESRLYRFSYPYQSRGGHTERGSRAGFLLYPGFHTLIKVGAVIP
jgi:hypothetical protein